MNNIIKKYIGKSSLLMAFALMTTGTAMTSCSDETLSNINTDKTKVGELDPNAQLTTALLQTYGDFSLMDTYRNYISGFPQYFAGGWNVTNYAGSNFREDDIARRVWDRYYEVSIKNLVDAIHNSADKANLNAALRIHRVYLTAVLADTYGDVPCLEAGLGYISGISTPKYDTVEELYSWFFEELDACEKQLGTGSDRISGDVTSMGGDVAKWKKYANALRMRYAMRISDVNPQKAKEEFEKAVAAGAIASAADDAYIRYADTPYTYYDGANDYDFRTNALGEILYGQDATSPTMVCSTLFYQLQNTNDPRLYRICRHYYNIKRSQVKPDKEQNIDLNDDFLAYFRSKNLGEEPCNPGATWYTDWMSPATVDDLPTLKKYAEIDKTSNKISKEEIDAFIANNPLGDNPKETINTQAWILHMMNPSEGWANMRRSDYPAILNRDLLTKNGFTYTDSNWSMPVRLQYPELEGQYNSANYKAAIDRMGGTDDWHKRLWWDKADVNLQPNFNPPFGKGYSK